MTYGRWPRALQFIRDFVGDLVESARAGPEDFCADEIVHEDVAGSIGWGRAAQHQRRFQVRLLAAAAAVCRA